jgi:cell division protein FtsW
MKVRISPSKIDWPFLTAVFFLVAFGILMVFDASSVSAVTQFNNKYYFAKEQLKGVIVGFIGLIVAACFDYRKFYKLSVPLILLCLVLLILVFLPGLGVKAMGAHRWIDFKFFILQPSELTKLAVVIYLSAWLSQKEKGRFAAFLLLVALIVGLVVLEPDMGTAFVLVFISVIIYFISGSPLVQFLLIIPGIIVGGLWLAVAAPYRFNRILTFFNPSADPLGTSYHVRQILIALGSGGFWGLGLGKSRQKFAYLPEASTDSIFAIIAEELGFVGATLVIMVFIFIIYKGYTISKNAPDKFGKLLAFGITTWLALQVIVNLSSMVALTPLTGIPLPFISYGSSSLAVILFAIGILINIDRQKKI